MGKIIGYFTLLLVLVTGGIYGFKVYTDGNSNSINVDTSNATNIKDKIVIATDDWQGYSYGCSNEMKKIMAKEGYLLVCKNDGANYDERFNKLRDDEYDLAFSTIDAYIKVGQKYNYPGAIVSMIDESKGGDAILSKNYKSINELSKATNTITVGYIKDSPSAFLWNVVSDNFGLSATVNEYDSESELMNNINNNDVIVIWEPSVTKLVRKGFNKVVGSESTNGLIMDVLIANRNVITDEKIKVYLSNYYAYMKEYLGNKDGVELYGVTHNQYFDNEEMFVNYINNIANILKVNLDNPYKLVNTKLIKSIIQEAQTNDDYPYNDIKEQLDNPASFKSYEQLTEKEWLRLKKVGNIKVNRIKFKSGSPMLTIRGKEELENVGKVINQYTYRVIIKGYSSLQGDKEINKKLSENRAKAVTNYLVRINGVDKNRIFYKGYGQDKPLKRNYNESWKNYNKRLQRVEFLFVKE